MHITSVELENIKSHANSRFEFTLGSTAITGNNGAGKTTIIEAIAWALFDVLDYKKDDFVRRGSKKGVARVSFVSSVDERQYTVYRDTGTGYYVQDPILGIRVVDKKVNVARFLWQHLGVEPGTDLESLYKQAIGVPQGTFTAIFLAAASDRKKTFDMLLKVEEYRRSADELLKTSRFIEGEISSVNVRIARSEGEIFQIETVKKELDEVSVEKDTLTVALSKITAESQAKGDAVKMLDEAEATIAVLANKLQAAKSASERSALIIAQRGADVARSREAKDAVEKASVDATRHVEALLRIQELERERLEREKANLELTKVETALVNVFADRKHLQADLEKIRDSHRVIADLRPKATEQGKLEKRIGSLKEKVAQIDAADRNAKSLDGRIRRLRDEYRANSEQLALCSKNAVEAANIESLLKRESEIVRELAGATASLERDEAFQREIKNGLCPILSEKCLNLRDGQTLENFVTSQFDELRQKIESLKNEQAATVADLRNKREAERLASQIPILERREAEIREEGERLKKEKEGFDKEIAELDEIQRELMRVESEVNGLGNPAARISFLEAESKREIEIVERLSAIEKNLERLESDRKIAAERLEAYKDLDQHWKESTSVREATAGAHTIFVANEALARQLDEQEAAYQKELEQSAVIADALTKAGAEFESAGRLYDRELHLMERAALAELQRQETETKTRLDLASKRSVVLSRELERLDTIRASMQTELLEKERLERAAEVTDFIRSTLKEAAPLVARNYVYHVSVEAGQMYREITGNADQTLRWGEDYGIVLEEGGYERPFINLSGGEQMAAALSVRLALLKQLSDIRIAFFDEPTTNMDADRRENLAQQIGNIRHFDQLFVISHDDTFEGYMDHELSIGE